MVRIVDAPRSGARAQPESAASHLPPGRVAVPVKPTLQMLVAGMTAGGVTPGEAFAVWQAMITTAP